MRAVRGRASAVWLVVLGAVSSSLIGCANEALDAPPLPTISSAQQAAPEGCANPLPLTYAAEICTGGTLPTLIGEGYCAPNATLDYLYFQVPADELLVDATHGGELPFILEYVTWSEDPSGQKFFRTRASAQTWLGTVDGRNVVYGFIPATGIWCMQDGNTIAPLALMDDVPRASSDDPRTRIDIMNIRATATDQACDEIRATTPNWVTWHGERSPCELPQSIQAEPTFTSRLAAACRADDGSISYWNCKDDAVIEFVYFDTSHPLMSEITRAQHAQGAQARWIAKLAVTGEDGRLYEGFAEVPSSEVRVESDGTWGYIHVSYFNWSEPRGAPHGIISLANLTMEAPHPDGGEDGWFYMYVDSGLAWRPLTWP